MVPSHLEDTSMEPDSIDAIDSNVIEFFQPISGRGRKRGGILCVYTLFRRFRLIGGSVDRIPGRRIYLVSVTSALHNHLDR